MNSYEKLLLLMILITLQANSQSKRQQYAKDNDNKSLIRIKKYKSYETEHKRIAPNILQHNFKPNKQCYN